MTETVRVADDLLARVLSPYHAHCRYLLEAEATFPDGDGGEPAGASGGPPRANGGRPVLASGRGRFAIPTSCYIQDTGHFNAVEFNICYNQLVYTLMAQCVASGRLPGFSAMTVETYLGRQLPDVLIHDFSSRFRRPMEARDFRGEVGIVEVRDRRAFLLVRTRVRFWSDAGGASDGDVTLAIVDRTAAPPGRRAADPAAAGPSTPAAARPPPPGAPDPAAASTPASFPGRGGGTVPDA